MYIEDIYFKFKLEILKDNNTANIYDISFVSYIFTFLPSIREFKISSSKLIRTPSLLFIDP